MKVIDTEIDADDLDAWSTDADFRSKTDMICHYLVEISVHANEAKRTLVSNESFDSHVFGFVPRGDIVGHATKIYWPLNRSGPLR